jgi:hypothetical protein
MNNTDKKLKIKHANPVSNSKMLSFIEEDLINTTELTSNLCEKLKKSTKGRCLFKSLPPNTKDGKRLAEIRDNIHRIRIYVRSMLEG